MAFKRKRPDFSEPLPVGEPSPEAPVPLSPPDEASPPKRESAESDVEQAGPPEAYEFVEPVPPSVPEAAPTETPPAETSAAEEPQKPTPRRAKPKPPEKKAKPHVVQLWNQRDELWKTLVIPLGVVVVGVAACFHPWNVLIGVLTVLAGLGMAGYRIGVSLDRPVRVTPEQGVREYFESLDHHLPNLRRMYLLLTENAKQAPEFDTFERFEAYWNYRLAQLRPAGSGRTPMRAKVKKFAAQYNRNRTWARASFTLEFYVRGSELQPVASCALTSELVKGSDNMWYLDEGRIPAPERDRSTSQGEG